MIPYNYHTHSQYSDGSNPPEDYITEAIKQGFKGLGFSEHSTLPFINTFALQTGNEGAYCKEINELKVKYSNHIGIYLSLEADFIPGISQDFKKLKEGLSLDYLIGSVHLVLEHNSSNLWFIDGPNPEIYDKGVNQIFCGDIRKAVTTYWHQVNSMIETETFDVIGHLDKIKMHNRGRLFSEQDKWYTDLVNETINLIAEKEFIVEINTRGLYKGRSDSLFPGEYIIHKLHEKGIGVMLSSDAHLPKEISLYFEEAIRQIQNCGYKAVNVFIDNKWKEISITRNES